MKVWAELRWQSRTAKMSVPASFCPCVVALTLGRLIQPTHQAENCSLSFVWVNFLNPQLGKGEETRE